MECSLPRWKVKEMKSRVLMGLEKNQTSDEVGAGGSQQEANRKLVDEDAQPLGFVFIFSVRTLTSVSSSFANFDFSRV